MIAWFARNHVAANLLMISIVFAGIFSIFNRIPLEVFPTVDVNTISVSMTLRGSSPEDAERGLATRIEEAISDIEGIDEYRSDSTEGGSQVIIAVENGYDARAILDDVKNRIDAISTFPAEAERPIISLAVRQRNVITVTVSGDVSEKEIRELIEHVRDDILTLPSVTQVSYSGIRDYEIIIEVSQDTLRQYDLTLPEISNAIQRSSLDLSAGSVDTDGGEILIRSKGQAYLQQDFASIIVKTNPDGSTLKLSDVAKVSDGFEEDDLTYKFNGKAAATVQVFRVGDQSAIQIADEVKAYVEKRQLTLPKNLELTYWDDDSELVKSRIKTLTQNAIQGGFLVFILLSLFLRPDVAFWVFIGIPVSFLGAFFIMPFIGVTINMVTLFAFIIVLGIVVDDAIVTGENIYTHMRTSETGIDAAIKGTQEVAAPVTFGVLTTVAAFAALGFIEGRRGQIFAQIPAVVIPVLIFSLIESKFVLPAHLKYLKVSKEKRESHNKLQKLQERFALGFENAILKYYQPALAYCLQHKVNTLIFFWGLLFIIIAAVSMGHTRFTFFPRIPSETVRATLTMPSGTPYSVTDRHIQSMTRAAQELRDKYIDSNTGHSVISHILTRTGDRGGQTNSGQVLFELEPPETRSVDINSQELTSEWRKMIGVIPGSEELIYRSEIGRTSDPIDIELRSNNLIQMDIISEKIKLHLATYPGVFDINDSQSNGKEELNIELKPEAHVLGMSRSDIITQVRQAFFGLEAQRIQRGRDDVRVTIRLPKNERQAISNLKNMLILTPTNQQIPLTQLVDFHPDNSPTRITRIDGYRTMNIRADIEKETVNMQTLQSSLREFIDKTLESYPGTSYKMGGESEEQAQSFNSMFKGLMAVFFIIYCLLAIPFKSYSQPIVVMSIIPFGFIGVMGGHWLMGMNLTVISIMGLLALVGVVVNDSLVLVDYINKRREEGADLYEAVLTAGQARFRPVILTSLTTFIGLIPLLFEKATQAQFLKPMAVSLGFGIMFATFTTLLLVPLHYVVLERVKYTLSAWRRAA